MKHFRFSPLLLLILTMSTLSCQTANYTNSNSNSSYSAQPLPTAQQAVDTQPAAERSPDTTGDAIVISTRANLRESPNASSNILIELDSDERLSLLQLQPVGAWYRVLHPSSGKKGWVHGNTIRLTRKAKAAQPVAQGNRPEETITNSNLSSARRSKERARANSRSDTYINSFGEEVPRPRHSDTVPAGASARCRDGTYSFSRNRRGTCSHHGGVAEWL